MTHDVDHEYERMKRKITQLQEALDRIKLLAGRQGPSNWLQAMHEIERTAKEALK